MASTTTITVAPAERQGVTSTNSESPDGKKPAGASQSLPLPADTIPAKKPLWRLTLVTVALLTGVFLVALDVNILGSSQFLTENIQGVAITARQNETNKIQLRQLRKSRLNFTASKMQPGIPRRTIWRNWPRSQRLAACIHHSPSNGHSVGVLWCLLLVSYPVSDFLLYIRSQFFLGKVLIVESRFHHLCRCTKLSCPDIRKSHSRLFHSWGVHRRPGYIRLYRLQTKSPALHLLHLYHVHGSFYSRSCPGRNLHREQLDLEVLFLDQSS